MVGEINGTNPKITLLHLALQSPTWAQARSKQRPPTGVRRPRGRLPPGRVDVRRSRAEVWAAPAEVQAVRAASPTSRVHSGGVRMRGRSSAGCMFPPSGSVVVFSEAVCL